MTDFLAPIKHLIGLITTKGRKDTLPFKELFVHFHLVLKKNTKIMEIITEMEDKLGGEYVFDQKFLQDSVASMKAYLLRSAYHFNIVTGNKHFRIYKVIEAIFQQLQQELAGHIVAAPGRNVLSLAQISSAMTDAVGNKAYRLSRALQLSGTGAIPPGAVVTIGGFRRYLAYNNLFGKLSELLAACQQRPSNLESIAQKIRLLILGGTIPPDLRRAILEEASRIDPRNAETIRYAVRSSAVGEDGELSFAGLHDSLLNVPFRELISAYKKILASLYNPEALEYRITHNLPLSEMAMAVLYQKMVAGRTSGVTYTLDPVRPAENVCLVTAVAGLGQGVVEGNAAVQTMWLSRDPPHMIVSTKAAAGPALPARENGRTLLPADTATEATGHWDWEQAAAVVELAMSLERFFKKPLDIEWSIDSQGQLWILQARPLALTAGRKTRSPELKKILAGKQKLIAGSGTIAYRGVGAGAVWIADGKADLNDFPTGAVLVSRYSLPVLARVIPRASAVITDIGSPTGHMATVAREFRVPTIVDTGVATKILKPGQLVTVDADRNTVYEGRIKELLHHQLLGKTSFETTYEFQLLRRLLKKIAPLTLVDPEGPDFTTQGCQTVHDVLRFMHEKSIKALLKVADNPNSLLQHGGLRLKSDLPLNLILIDIGGGLEPDSDRSQWVEPRNICSLPMQALWSGLSSPATWNTEPVAADFKGLVSSLTRTQASAVTGHIMTGFNVAVLGTEYLNLTLRVGYHFTVVDASMGSRPGKNNIFFRFLGGATDIKRRSRRAELMAAILEKFGFKVEKKADLVIARINSCAQEQCRQHLYILGCLLGFVRQLDILMTDDDSVGHYFKQFMENYGKISNQPACL